MQRMVVVVQMAVNVFLDRKRPVHLPPHEGAVRDVELVVHEQVPLAAQRDLFGHRLPVFDVCKVLPPVPAAEGRGDLAVVAFRCLPCEADGSKVQPRRRASVGVLPQSMYGGWESWWVGWLLRGGFWCVIAAVAVAICDGGRREITMTGKSESSGHEHSPRNQNQTDSKNYNLLMSLIKAKDPETGQH